MINITFYIIANGNVEKYTMFFSKFMILIAFLNSCVKTVNGCNMRWRERIRKTNEYRLKYSVDHFNFKFKILIPQFSEHFTFSLHIMHLRLIVDDLASEMHR
jgi:hypothetical protein